MENYTEKTYSDRSKWRDGQWNTEPDEIEWQDENYTYFMRRNMFGNWCGYVGIPESHPLYQKDYNDVQYFNVHGDLTWSSSSDKDNLWYFGFDTSHLGDLSPDTRSHIFENDSYKNIDYVKAEVINLGKQLREYAI